ASSYPGGAAQRTTPAARAAGVWSLQRPVLLGRRAHLGAAVELTALVGLVGRDRLGLAVRGGVDLVGGHALADQVVLDRAGATLAQTLVVAVGADPVGVTVDLHAQVRILLAELVDRARGAVQIAHRLVGQIRLVEGEQDVGEAAFATQRRLRFRLRRRRRGLL